MRPTFYGGANEISGNKILNYCYYYYIKGYHFLLVKLTRQNVCLFMS